MTTEFEAATTATATATTLFTAIFTCSSRAVSSAPKQQGKNRERKEEHILLVERNKQSANDISIIHGTEVGKWRSKLVHYTICISHSSSSSSSTAPLLVDLNFVNQFNSTQFDHIHHHDTNKQTSKQTNRQT